MKKNNGNQIPVFNSPEEERGYWEARGLLNENIDHHKNSTTKIPRASFLNIRLTGEEITGLRDLAGSRGMGPSTLARSILKKTLDEHFQADLNEPIPVAHDKDAAADSDAVYTTSLPDKGLAAKSDLAICDLGETQVDSQIVLSIFNSLRQTCRCRIVKPHDKDYQLVKSLMIEKAP